MFKDTLIEQSSIYLIYKIYEIHEFPNLIFPKCEVEFIKHREGISTRKYILFPPEKSAHLGSPGRKT